MLIQSRSTRIFIVSASIIGDVKAVLTVINRRLEAQEHKEWLDTVKEYKENIH